MKFWFVGFVPWQFIFLHSQGYQIPLGFLCEFWCVRDGLLPLCTEWFIGHCQTQHVGLCSGPTLNKRNRMGLSPVNCHLFSWHFWKLIIFATSPFFFCPVIVTYINSLKFFGVYRGQRYITLLLKSKICEKVLWRHTLANIPWSAHSSSPSSAAQIFQSWSLRVTGSPLKLESGTDRLDNDTSSRLHSSKGPSWQSLTPVTAVLQEATGQLEQSAAIRKAFPCKSDVSW